MRRTAAIAIALVTASGPAGCGGSDEPGYRAPHMPSADHFVDHVDHPYYPLPVGATWVYRGTSSDGAEQVTVSVLPDTRVVDGVRATVVHDQSTLNGKLSEDTYDWFAQDDRGNVWYLGEATTAYDTDGSTSTEGSWEAGVHGASAGIVMPAKPRVGDRYQQEQQTGVAEDRGEILSLTASGKVPWGSFSDAVRTRDTTPLEPDDVEHKYYVKGVGDVLEDEGDEHLELVSFTPGSPS
ncbi:MAG TPA: hypothetical protein VFE07_03455 [Marmoricola sp.]|nr:hypothetical protein [Marmoricola sp.]